MSTADQVQHVSSFDWWKLVKKTAFFLLLMCREALEITFVVLEL